MSSNHPLVSRLIVILFLMPGLATLLLVTPMADELGLVGEARGEDGTPEWSYSTGEEVKSVAISADGEYIAAGVIANGRVYLFHKDSSTPLWSHDTGDGVWSVAISADGEYIAAGSHDYKIYIFRKNSSTPLWSYTTDDNVNSVAISADGE